MTYEQLNDVYDISVEHLTLWRSLEGLCIPDGAARKDTNLPKVSSVSYQLRVVKPTFEL